MAEDFVYVNSMDIQSSGLQVDEDRDSLALKLNKINSSISSLKENILNLEKELAEKEKEHKEILSKLEEVDFPKLEIQLREPTITKSDDVSDKANFLFDLFHGRRDVYASRRWDKKTQRTSYSPQCINFWAPGCLFRIHKEGGGEGKKPNCSKCNVRLYEELSPALIILRQLNNKDEYGRNGIGLYPMLPGNVCRFMAIDLDESTWQDDCLTIAQVARSVGFQIAIERSFSGNGAHLWLFFSEEISASKVRKLAFSFLDKACHASKNLSLKSYDRIFPSQDRVEEDGLGNLILMPLLLCAVMRKNNPGTVFVDNSFKMYSDQIAFLSSLPKYSERDIDLYLAKEEKNASFSYSLLEPEEVDVLWQRKLPKLGKNDCNCDELPIFQSAGISIPKAALTPKLQNALKRMSCFSNPKYYKTIRRNKGYVVSNISSFIETYLESDSVLQIPRGLFSMLSSYLDKNSIAYKVIDKRYTEPILKVSFKGELKEAQEVALDALMKVECGILKAATSFGKTVVAAALISKRKEKTLILVHKQNLLDQWKQSLMNFISIENEPIKREGKRKNKEGIGLYGNSKDSLSGYVDIATFQTISSRMPSFIQEYGIVIVDECHHVAADTFLQVMNAIRPKYVYGLSATVKREDGLENIVYSQCGKVAFEYTADKLAYSRGILQCFVPRFTSVTLPIDVARNFNHTEAVKSIASDEGRNELIIQDANKLVENKHKVLILTSLVSHVQLFKVELNKGKHKVVTLSGSMSKSELNEALKRISNDDFDIIVATGQYLGEGTDIRSLDSLLLATPVAWEGVVSQYAGRIAREYTGKRMTCIIDYVDTCIPQFYRMYLKRIKTYRKLGYVIENDDLEVVSKNSCGLMSEKVFFMQSDILEPFITAIRSARDRIVISSPQLYLSNATKSICSQLEKAISGGIKVEVISSTIEHSFNQKAHTEGLEYLSSLGIATKLLDDCFQEFAVMDSDEIWYGDINILGGAIGKMVEKEEEHKTMLHMFNKQAADSLVASCEMNLLL